MKTNMCGFVFVFLAFFCQLLTAEKNFTPAVIQTNFTPAVIDTNVTRRVMGSVMFPDGSPWCKNKPTFWFTGHIKSEMMFCQNKFGRLNKKWLKFMSAIDRHGCAGFDVDKDGLVDIICTRGASKGTSTGGANEVYLTKENGTFKKILNHGMESLTSRSKNFVPFKSSTGDDLIFESVNGYPRKDGLDNRNQLYKWVPKQEDGTYFVKVPGPWDTEALLPFVVKVVDFDGDGKLDLFVHGRELIDIAKKKDGYQYVVNIYLQREDNKFIKYESSITRRYEAATTADLNNDGQPDIIGYHALSQSFYILWNHSNEDPSATLSFKGSLKALKNYNGNYEMNHYVGGITVLDVDGDGFMDIYVTQSRDEEDEYCYRKVVGGYPKVIKNFGLKKNQIDFVPPPDPIPDILFVNEGVRKGRSQYPMFSVHEMNLDLRGCAGKDLVPFGDQRLAISYSSLSYPGRMYLLDWSKS